MKRTFTRLGESLGGVMDSLPPSERRLLRLIAAWPSIVGDDLARRSRPTAVGDGTLHLEVTHEGWVRSLRAFEDRVCCRATELTGTPVRRFRIRVSGGSPPPPTPERTRSTQLPTHWRTVVEQCEDPELRRALQGMLAAYWSRHEAP